MAVLLLNTHVSWCSCCCWCWYWCVDVNEANWYDVSCPTVLLCLRTVCSLQFVLRSTLYIIICRSCIVWQCDSVTVWHCDSVTERCVSLTSSVLVQASVPCLASLFVLCTVGVLGENRGETLSLPPHWHLFLPGKDLIILLSSPLST